MVINRVNLTATPSDGSFSLTIPNSVHALLQHIHIKPVTDSTTYDLVIADQDGYEQMDATEIEGLFLHKPEIPFTGSPVLSVSNASANEEFRVVFTFIER